MEQTASQSIEVLEESFEPLPGNFRKDTKAKSRGCDHITCDVASAPYEQGK